MIVGYALRLNLGNIWYRKRPQSKVVLLNY